MYEIARKHTPGPWEVGAKHPAAVYDAAGWMVAETHAFTDNHKKWDPNAAAANARLVASAPTLADIAMAACNELAKYDDFLAGALWSSIDAAINGTAHWTTLEELKARYAGEAAEQAQRAPGGEPRARRRAPGAVRQAP